MTDTDSTAFDRYHMDIAHAAMRRAFPRRRVRRSILGLFVTAGPWYVTCHVAYGAVEVRMETQDEDHAWPAIAETAVRGERTEDGWHEAILRALRRAARRIDAAARSLPFPP